ncbi:hypothetical protein [Pseudaeromonas paramecii]|uniref:hypothetical protein n=1 Tax=Pseudaeromonas paramecii TaxID=2138166 RepID=UPI0031ECFD80
MTRSTATKLANQSRAAKTDGTSPHANRVSLRQVLPLGDEVTKQNPLYQWR